MALVRACSILTPIDCVDSQNQLSKIKREQGESVVLEQIVYLISWANSAFHKGLTESSVFEVSLSILNDYWFFKIEDIVLFASEMRKGNLVKIAYHLEMQHFYEALKVYDQRRTQAIQSRHNQIKSEGDMPRQPELSEAQKLGGMIKHIDKGYEK